MKKSLIALAAYAATSVYAAPVGIASGNPTGTNFPMIEDIRKVCSKQEAPIFNVVTNGSIENIFKVYEDKTTQYGIAQVDAAEYQKLVDKKMMDRVVMVFPFFSTEFHLIAKDGSSINSLTDLAGKRIVEGPEGSGTWITVQMIKRITGIQWQTVPGNLSQQQGYDAVKSGQADAEFIIAGKPVGMLKSATGIKLVPVTHANLDKVGMYTSTTIFPGGEQGYSFQKQPVKTYKVDNMLMTYAFKTQYQKEIGDLVTCITQNLGTLQKHGHPKWKDVDPLDIERISWPAHPAAVNAIKREAKKQ